MGDGGWRMGDGGWVLGDGGWRLEDGGWVMGDGRLENKRISRYLCNSLKLMGLRR
jgi:hypothetical protein